MTPSTLAMNTAHEIIQHCKPRSLSPNRLSWIPDQHPLMQLVASLVQDAIDQAQPASTAATTIPLPDLVPFRDD